MRDLSSLTRDPCGGSVEPQPVDHQGSPYLGSLIFTSVKSQEDGRI